MIPRHRPPFGSLSLLRTVFRSWLKRADVSELECGYQESLDVKHAIWIPSARWGITRTIQLHVASSAEVVCPVFNCGAVHHAVSQCERRIAYRDCASGSFRMDCSGEANGGHAVVLSELFGHRFSPADLSQPLVRGATVKIFDLAMGIPTAADVQRMSNSDVAVLSFGLGKSLYAGWGGMALTNCDATASVLRRQRDEQLSSVGRLNRTRWNAEVLARTLAHEPIVYRQVRSSQNRRGAADVSGPSSFSTSSREWHRPPTSIHVAQSLLNLKHATEYAERRTELTAEYHAQLSGFSSMLQVPNLERAALSHYSVRIPAAFRESLRRELWDSGIDAATLFPFPTGWCKETDYPNAQQASDEVLNLPLSNQLDCQDVIRICDQLKKAMAAMPQPVATQGFRPSPEPTGLPHSDDTSPLQRRMAG